MFSKLFGKKQKNSEAAVDTDQTLEQADAAIFSKGYVAYAHDEQQKAIDKASKIASTYVNSQNK